MTPLRQGLGRCQRRRSFKVALIARTRSKRRRTSSDLLTSGSETFSAASVPACSECSEEDKMPMKLEPFKPNPKDLAVPVNACRCKPPLKSGRKYMSHEACGKCGLLIRP